MDFLNEMKPRQKQQPAIGIYLIFLQDFISLIRKKCILIIVLS